MNMRTLSRALLPLFLSAVYVNCQYLGCHKGPGVYSLPDNCNQFYECQLNGKYLVTALKDCPPGSNFDDNHGECRPQNLVTSPPQCMQVTPAVPEVVPIDDFATDMVVEEGLDSHVPAGGENVTGDGAVNFNHTVVNGVNGTNDSLLNQTAFVNVTEEIVVELPEITLCDHMNVIDNYSTLAISNPSLQESFEHQKQYNKNIMKYNKELEVAQNNTLLWRHGNSISSGVKRTYQKANEFKSEFDRKLKINQQLIQKLSIEKSDPNFDQKLENEIKSLQEEIKNTEAAMSITNVAAVQQYFEGLIASKRQEIERKQQQKGSNTLESRKLGERINLLEYIRDDAIEVIALATDWQGQMEPLLSSLRGDLIAFAKYFDRANAGITLLTEEEEYLKDVMVENAAEQERLNNEKETLNGDIDYLNDANSMNLREISHLIEVISNKTEEYQAKMEALCIPNGPLMGINTNYTHDGFEKKCKYILRRMKIVLDTTQEESNIKKLRGKSSSNRREITGMLRQLDNKSQEIVELFGATPQYQTKLRQVNHELSSLQTHANDVSDLQKGVWASIDSLVKIMEEFQVLREIFDASVSEIEAMIAQGEAVRNEDERRTLDLVLEKSISDFQLQLEQLDFTDLVNCS